MLLATESACSIFVIVLVITTNIISINSSKCNRTPEGHGALQTPADGRFHIRILENANKYTPGKTYTSKYIACVKLILNFVVNRCSF